MPLQGARVLDVGCGAGLLSEAHGRGEGAQVTALDLAPELIEGRAGCIGLESGVKVDYRLVSVEALADEMPAPVRRHHLHGNARARARSGRRCSRACATLLKPGGRLFLSTLNRTPAAFALAIVGAEYIARILPKGTHQYRDFIKPSELAALAARRRACELEDVSGLIYEPWRNAARVGARTDVNYLACAAKPA